MTESAFSRWRARLNAGDSFLTRDIGELLRGGKLDENAVEALEDTLLMADAGVEATEYLVGHLRERVAAGRIRDEQALRAELREAVTQWLEPVAEPLRIPDFIRPYILFVTGVNGAGKTTTIGKLAHRFRQQGHSVLLAAGDTFRAAAVEQLQAWGGRAGVPVISQGAGADSASVIYDAVEAAKARGCDVVIADTAGRLHTQAHLMEELRKIKRVLQKHDAYAPHELMLVLDATTGGNAMKQALEFHEAIGLTGLTLTKLDGTAKGGIVLALAKRLSLPIRYVGLGEGIEDLAEFDAAAFAEALTAV